MRVNFSELSHANTWKLILPVMATVVLATTGLSIYLPRAMKSSAIETVYRNNLQVTRQLKEIRSFYSAAVATKVKLSGHIPITTGYGKNAPGIPFPTTFIMDVAQQLSNQYTKLVLTSPYPWPNRAGRKMDDFQKSAWRAFQKGPDSIFSREEYVDGKRVLKVAVADRMVDPSCVACHDSSPNSPKRDWKLNDVRAVMEVSTVVEPYLHEAERQSAVIVHAIQGVAGVALAALLILGFAGQRRARERKEALGKLHYLAHHDTMTGVLKRSSFVEKLELMLSKSGDHACIGLHYVDVDHFKSINDSFGHAAGNAIVSHVAERLKRVAGEHGFVGRVGGDEFMLAHAGIRSAGDLAEKAEEIMRCFDEVVILDDNRISVSVSVGSAMLGATEWSVETFIQKADAALYQAKKAGRGRYHLYDESLGILLDNRRLLEMRIWEAIRTGEFELHFQAVFGAADASLQGFEALLRMRDREGRPIAPTDFIPVAEEIGAVSEIGKWVIREACAFAARLPERLFVAVNVSPAQFASGGVLETVRAALKENGLSGERLEIEITESLFFNRPPEVLRELAELRELGVSIAIDDFGTGYSSLSCFADIPVGKIKIDRAFVAGWERGDASAVPVLESIVSLCRCINVSVTTEGIETAEQAAYFASLGCDYLQGFHLAYPQPEHELGPLLVHSSAGSGSGKAIAAQAESVL